ncbi:MAG: hypothetical protein EOR63_32260 [Mesorhizobium sp.]|nr:MAG: hypothetical protein EOR63_32260 [Mesorhizobium sp.]
MTDDDLHLIEKFAAGDHSLRESAIGAYRRALSAGIGENMHMLFMAEVDNSVPDLALRASYRQQLLQATRGGQAT